MVSQVLAAIPAALVGLRVLIAPFLVWDAADGETSIGFLLAFGIAFLSDILDGVIARRLQASTAALRQADSWADRGLYGGVAIATAFAYPDVLITFALPLLWVIGAQLLWWIVNLAKYGKPASYHTYSAKFWGITLLFAVVALFGFNYAGITLWLAIITGIIHSLEEIAMTLILPVWTHDVLSIVHAWKLRAATVKLE